MLNPRFVASGTGSSAMMDGELKKTSVRANRLEKKRFEMMLSAYDSAKRNVANEIKKSQVDVKRRLKKYKDRQREILVTKSEPVPTNPDDHMLQHIRRLSRARSGPHHHHHHASLSFQTPAQDDLENVHQDLEGTGDHGPADSSTTITTSTSTTAASCSTLGSVTLPAPPDEDDIPSLSSYHHHHQQKSKADLRPYLAWTALHNSASPDPGSSSSTTTTSTTSRSLTTTTTGSSVKLLQLRGGRLGTPSRQVRYLDEEEIEQRCSFHRLLLSKYRHLENQRLEKINDLVGEFCGKSGGRGSLTAVSCPPIIVGEGVGVGVVSLPVGVPPSVHRAMRVKKFPLERWAKGNASVNHRSEFK